MSVDEIPSLNVVVDLVTKRVRKTYLLNEIKQKIPFIPNEALFNLTNASLTIKLRSPRIRQILEDLPLSQKEIFLEDLMYFSIFQRFYSPFTSLLLTEQYITTTKQLQRTFSYSSKIANGIYLGIYEHELSWGVTLSLTFSSILGSFIINPAVFGTIIPLIIKYAEPTSQHVSPPPTIIPLNPQHKPLLEQATQDPKLNETWEQTPLVFTYLYSLLKILENQYLSTGEL